MSFNICCGTLGNLAMFTAIRNTSMSYNFCRIHKPLRVTPAMAAGVTGRLWGIGDIVKVLEVGCGLLYRPRGS